MGYILQMYAESPLRTVVKTVVYRIWVLLSTYLMLIVTGQSWDTAVLPTVTINVIWTVSYYVYDRIWARISWGTPDPNK